jgi:uncharacterized membrane protein (UPF0182 family)
MYLRATASGGAPTELQFVIVATNEQVEMRDTLEAALAAVAQDDEAEGPGGTTANVEDGSQTTEPTSATVNDALAAFERGERALRNGDWETYGEAQADLQRILQLLALGSATMPAPGVEPAIPGTPVP